MELFVNKFFETSFYVYENLENIFQISKGEC